MMKLTAQARAKAPSSCFAIRELRKYYLCDKRHVASAVKYFRENSWRYPPAMRASARTRIIDAYLKQHFPSLTPKERKGLHAKTKRYLKL